MSEKNESSFNRAFLKGKIVNFKPRDIDECIYIQERLFEMGFSWSGTGVGIWRPEICLKEGFHLKKDGRLYVEKSEFAIDLIIKCRKTQRQIMLELLKNFNKLSKRIEVIEEKQDKILKAISPKVINKANIRSI